jgi:coenzyme PQQ synthesis protein D (PqqD)
MPDTPDLPKARSGIETYIVPDGTCFLYNPASDASYVLDQVGALVWDFCDGNSSVSAIISELTALAPGDDGMAARVTTLLTEFASEGLLDAARAGAGGLGTEATANDA